MPVSETTILVEHVTMRFNLSTERIDSLKEYVIKLVKKELLYNEFTALQDVSLRVYKGEVLGIVGYNGAGKSTLLKIIAKVIKPTSGRVQVHGRIAPLIELGAGFDPNLTGRENIFMNGLTLGLTEKFIKDNYQEIVAFSELEKFIDVPLKNYSSGMKARLGFAVATSIKPDILIVDEVLSVGDAKFQMKCRERIHELLKRKTTVLLVSHSLQTIKDLCDRCLWLDYGQVKAIGTTGEILESFANS